MSFSDFFQQNIIFFVAALAIFAYLMFLELKRLKTRGADLTPSQLTQRVNAGAQLIDLRRADDFRAGHISGAKNIQMEDLDNHIDQLGDKTKPIVLYCYSGGFSGRGVGLLKKAGFTDVTHLSSGMNAWQQDNLPTTKS